MWTKINIFAVYLQIHKIQDALEVRKERNIIYIKLESKNIRMYIRYRYIGVDNDFIIF